MPISLAISKRKKPLCNTLNWGIWNSGFVGLGVWWAERDFEKKRKKIDKQFVNEQSNNFSNYVLIIIFWRADVFCVKMER